ncbi:MAG: nuclear transport factor 2 family protein [Alphaproteobacteria bacterium]
MTRDIRQLVDRFYEIVNTGEGSFSEIFTDDFELGIMAGFPYGGTHIGLAATETFFADFGAHFEFWAVDTDRFISIDDSSIVVTGKYRSQAVSTGHAFEMETVHLWTAKDGYLTTYKHYCDTAIVSAALNHDVPQY